VGVSVSNSGKIVIGAGNLARRFRLCLYPRFPHARLGVAVAPFPAPATSHGRSTRRRRDQRRTNPEVAWDARSAHVDEKADGIKKLKQMIASFIEYRSPVPGECFILTSAVDSDDGNSVLRAKVAKALRSWLTCLQTIVNQAQKRSEARAEIDAKSVATLIVASLEGALMLVVSNAIMTRFGVDRHI
jgi:hypothetical protein